MTYAAGYLVLALLTFALVRAVQRAVLASPLYDARRKIEASCRFCEPINNMPFTCGYACGLHRTSGGDGYHVYPFSLTLAAAIVGSVFWWAVPVFVGARMVQDYAFRRVKPLVERRVIERQDRAEVERLLREEVL